MPGKRVLQNRRKVEVQWGEMLYYTPELSTFEETCYGDLHMTEIAYLFLFVFPSIFDCFSMQLSTDPFSNRFHLLNLYHVQVTLPCSLCIPSHSVAFFSLFSWFYWSYWLLYMLCRSKRSHSHPKLEGNWESAYLAFSTSIVEAAKKEPWEWVCLLHKPFFCCPTLLICMPFHLSFLSLQIFLKKYKNFLN